MIDILKWMPNLIYIGNSGNHGDTLIQYSQFMFFKNNNIKYTQLNESNRHILNDRFNLVYSGNGAFVNVYRIDYQRIINDFLKTKI